MESGRTLDSALAAADRALRAVFAPARSSRPTPQPAAAPAELSDAERRTAAALMRVNHTGELAAQALYHGQALFAHSEATRRVLMEAARGESDHLAWCETRLERARRAPEPAESLLVRRLLRDRRTRGARGRSREPRLRRRDRASGRGSPRQSPRQTSAERHPQPCDTRNHASGGDRARRKRHARRGHAAAAAGTRAHAAHRGRHDGDCLLDLIKPAT